MRRFFYYFSLMPAKKILLVEDEVQVASFIRKGLSEENYEVTVAFDGKAGLQYALENTYGLIILDIMLPEMNGLEVCREIRKVNNEVSILMLTALGTSENIVMGLETGADDYLVKPFRFNELLARVRALLRRGNSKEQVAENINGEHLFKFSDIELNDYSKTVTKAGQEITLTTTEYRLLHMFLKNPKRVLTRMDILEEVWGVNFNLGTNVVDVYINYLRKKIDNESSKLIHTVIGVGYVLKEE